MTAKGIDFTGIAYLIGIGAAAFVVYKVVKAGPATVESVVTAVKGAVGDAIDAVTPTNPNNVFNRVFQPVADLFIGSDPEAAAKANGSRLLAQMTSTMESDDAEIGAAGRLLMRRPDLLGNSVADADDAAQGVAIAEGSGMAFIDYSKLSRGVFK